MGYERGEGQGAGLGAAIRRGAPSGFCPTDGDVFATIPKRGITANHTAHDYSVIIHHGANEWNIKVCFGCANCAAAGGSKGGQEAGKGRQEAGKGSQEAGKRLQEAGRKAADDL